MIAEAVKVLNSASHSPQNHCFFNRLSLRVKSAYPQGLETLRSLQLKFGGGCAFEPSRSARKPRPNLRLSAVPEPGETGCEREEWSSEGNRELKVSGRGETGDQMCMSGPRIGGVSILELK